ncbi:chemotaxis protein histidine kinase CheA [Bradyrhizobium sp. USDA 4516]
MAEEAFALSPISARAALPSEEDYAAISAAFMETSRGRWFLGEYAKRNRNADTRMVLDAVARIEESLSAQRQAAAAAIRDEQLAQALAALRGAIEAAQASAIAALDGISFEQSLAPVRKGVRVIREISWRLREIGNDGRICDIIDSQVSAIEAGAAEVSMNDAKAVLDAAFAALARRLSEFDPDKAATPAAEPDVAEAPVAEPPAAAATPPPVADGAALDMAATPPAPPQEAAAARIVEAAILAAAPGTEAATAVTPQPSEAWLKAEAALAEAEAAELARVTDETAADAHDDAVLDLIAMEMGAPDPIDEEAIAEEMRAAEEMRVAEAMAAEPKVVAPAIQPEPAPAPAPKVEVRAEVKIEPVAVAPIAETLVMPPPLRPAVEPAPAPAAEISLGSTIIASGLLKRPTVAANDPLAPIRRMSQAEKIAFFS